MRESIRNFKNYFIKIFIKKKNVCYCDPSVYKTITVNYVLKKICRTVSCRALQVMIEICLQF